MDLEQVSAWIQQHPLLSATITIGVFFLWRLPEWFGQVWPLFTDKTLPKWIAEQRWPAMSTVLYKWFNVLSVFVVFVMLGIIVYQQHGEDSKREPVAASPLESEQVGNSKIALVDAAGRLQTDPDFASLLRSFPPSSSLPSSSLPSPFILPSRKKVAIRANESSFAWAKDLGQRFKKAQWAVVGVDNTLDDRFPDGITIRAQYDSGDAENIHVALCKLGYAVNRKLFDAPLSVGILTPLPPDYITLEIGNISP